MRGANGGVVGAATGGEGVGRLLGGYIDARHRQAGAAGEPLNDSKEGMIRPDFLGASRGQCDLIAEIEARNIHHGGDHEGDENALLPGDEAPADEDQAGEEAEENDCLDVVIELPVHLFFLSYQ